MKRFLDALLARQPVPTHSNGFFPLNPMPLTLVRSRKHRKPAMGKRPALARPPMSQR